MSPRLLALLLLAAPLAAAQTPSPFFAAPAAIPGIIQAEDFDRGGQGVAYNDTAPANDGGQYRATEGVDIFTSSGAPGGYVIKNFALGEWMTYTVEVAANGWYDFQVRMASKVDTARFHIEIDGVDVTGAVAVPITSSTTWEAYQWFTVKKRVPLTAGTHVMKIVSDATWVGLDAFNITPSAVGTPFDGTPATVPGIIQVENFNEGGPGVAYSDTDAVNDGTQYRPSEGVDIFTSSGAPGGYVIKNFATGEWMVYTVNVPATGMYDFKVRVATKLDTSKFHIEVDGVNVTGTVAVPSTSAETWEAYQWIVAKTLVPLEAGTRHLAIVSDEQWVGIDAIEIGANALRPVSGTPAAVPGVIEAENFDLGGEGVAYHETTPTNEGGQHRPGEGVDLFTSSGAPGGFVVKNFATGEWMTYTINVQTATQYDFKVRLATKLDTSRFHIEIDGADVTGTVVVPSTSTTTWEDYQWHTAKTNVPLSQGTHTMRIVSDQEWVGLDKFEIIASAAPPPAGEVKFFCSFETSPTDCGFTEEANGTGRASLVNFGRDGGRAVRLHTEPGGGISTTENDRNDLRLQPSTEFCQEGREEWWAHSVWFPDDYAVPPTGHWGVVADFHHVHPTESTRKQANFHVDAMPSGLRLRGYGGANLDDNEWTRPIRPVEKKRWYDFVYHVKWSSGNDGFFDVWLNGEKIRDPQNPTGRTWAGPTLYVGYTCTFKLANYHSRFGTASSVIHDRVVRGTTAESVSLTPLEEP